MSFFPLLDESRVLLRKNGRTLKRDFHSTVSMAEKEAGLIEHLVVDTFVVPLAKNTTLPMDDSTSF